MAKQETIKDSDKSKNIQVEVDGQLSLGEMEAILADVARDLELLISHITMLSRKKISEQQALAFQAIL